MSKRCVCCKASGADDWLWQPFGPDESVINFSFAGEHYRGFAALAVCDTCKETIGSGAAVEFTYKRRGYTLADGEITAKEEAA